MDTQIISSIDEAKNVLLDGVRVTVKLGCSKDKDSEQKKQTVTFVFDGQSIKELLKPAVAKYKIAYQTDLRRNDDFNNWMDEHPTYEINVSQIGELFKTEGGRKKLTPEEQVKRGLNSAKSKEEAEEMLRRMEEMLAARFAEQEQ